MAHIVVAVPAVKDDDLPETLKHLYALSSWRQDLTVVAREQISEYGRLKKAGYVAEVVEIIRAGIAADR